jgi:hypothetical protein
VGVVGHNPQAVPGGDASFEKTAGHLVASLLICPMGEPHLIENDAVPVWIKPGIVGDEVIDGQVTNAHALSFHEVSPPRSSLLETPSSLAIEVRD